MNYDNPKCPRSHDVSINYFLNSRKKQLQQACCCYKIYMSRTTKCLSKFWIRFIYGTGCPKKHWNSVKNWISSLLWISIVLPSFKSHNIIMYARVYFMKMVKNCKYVSIMSPQDEEWRRTSLLCLYTAIFLFY